MLITCPNCSHEFIKRKRRTTRVLRKGRVNADPVEMARLYREGLTLEKIGQKFGCTREWVRQVLKAHGVTYRDGGQHMAAAGRKEARAAKRLTNYEKRRGFTLQWRREMSQKYTFNGHDPYRIWERKRNNINRDGALWRITFPEWMDLWIASGKLPEYGKGGDAYCAVRIDDAGPWIISNLRIIRFSMLVRELRAREKAEGRGCFGRAAA